MVENVDLAPESQQFVVLAAAEGPNPGATQQHTMLILNFFGEVRRRVAAGQG